MSSVAEFLATPQSDRTALAQLVAIHIANGVSATRDLARLTGYSERAVLKAKKELGCGTIVRNPGADAHPGAELGCGSEPECGTPVRSSRAPIRACLETPSGLDSTLEVLDSPSSVPPKRKAAPRGARLSADWTLPDDWQQWARINFAHASDAMVALEADKFRDFWCSKAGQSACKLDWEATWRNWCRTAFAAVPGKQPVNWGRASWDEQRAAKHEQTRALLASLETMGAA